MDAMDTAVLETWFRGCSQALLYKNRRPHQALSYRTPQAVWRNGAAGQACGDDGQRKSVAHMPYGQNIDPRLRFALLAALHRCFGLVEVTGEDGGLHIFLHLPPDFFDASTVGALEPRMRVGLYVLANAGADDSRDTILSRRGLVLGYAALTPKPIEKGVARLAGVLEEAIPSPERRAAYLPGSSRCHTCPGAQARKSGSPNRQPPALRGRPQPRAMLARHSRPWRGTDMPVVTRIS